MSSLVDVNVTKHANAWLWVVKHLSFNAQRWIILSAGTAVVQEATKEAEALSH